MKKKTLKFGRWPSDISAEFVAGKTLRFQSVQALGDWLYWTELRPLENGRAALVCIRPNAPPNAPPNGPPTIIDLLPAPFSARSKVHEYGGGAFLVANQQIFFVNADDQQIWSIKNQQNTPQSSTPKQITHAPEWRFADLCLDPSRNRLICVGERADQNGGHPQNLLISISLDERNNPPLTALVEGDDFYASPRLSPDGTQLAFVSWNLPAMPWEAAKLQIAHFQTDGSVTKTTTPDNLHHGASFQPEWDQQGDLWFINDETGSGQLYRLHAEEITLFPQDGVELGAPLWNFGMKTYAFLPDGRIAARCLANGKAWISLIDPTNNSHSICPGTEKPGICGLEQLVSAGDGVAGILSTFDQPNAIASISILTGQITTHKTSIKLELKREQISIAKALEFENELGQTVYGNYYPPTNQLYEGPTDELPPVILTAHGGPTAYSDAGLTPKVQYWTSRGFGYFDVNYGGSWGFGKAYRQRLDEQWGVRDVADMVAAAKFLTDTHLADASSLLISGSSAGGYTVLMALVKSDLFAGGASYYGISDLARLCDSTHKFEAGYLEGLLGLTEQNRAFVLKQRSPLFSAAKITSPVIFFQGLQDRVVPPDQAELMVDALQNNGVDTIYKSFETEGHGFRAKQTIETALTMEYDFYTRILAQ